MKTVQEYFKDVDIEKLIKLFFQIHPIVYESENCFDESVKDRKGELWQHM